MSVTGWLKKATTLPKKGRLSGLARVARPLVGDNIMDEIGTVGGFMLGGPGGAAAGRAAGNFVHTQDLGKGLRAGAEGYLMGTGASALQGAGGIGGLARGATQGGARGIGGRIAKAATGGVNWLTDKDQGAARQQMVTSLLGTGANVYGAAQEGAAADDELERRLEEERRRREVAASYTGDLGSFLNRR